MQAKGQRDTIAPVNAPKAIDFNSLAALVKGHREGRTITLRQAAEQCGVSAATLSRIERGDGRPDLDTVKLLVDWVGVPIERVLVGPAVAERLRKGPKTAPAPLEQVEIQFRADPNLAPEAAESLIRIVREAYKAMIGGSKQE